MKACFALTLSSSGVQIHERTSVSHVLIQKGRVTGVETDRGKIHCQYFVNCAGQVGLFKPVFLFPFGYDAAVLLKEIFKGIPERKMRKREVLSFCQTRQASCQSTTVCPKECCCFRSDCQNRIIVVPHLTSCMLYAKETLAVPLF